VSDAAHDAENLPDAAGIARNIAAGVARNIDRWRVNHVPISETGHPATAHEVEFVCIQLVDLIGRFSCLGSRHAWPLDMDFFPDMPSHDTVP
jgi:hypothetical protein